jgi:hypothetical protein
VFGNIDSLKQARLEELRTFDRLEVERDRFRREAK